jgi:hypothetical protein
MGEARNAYVILVGALSGDTAFSWQRDCMPHLKQRAMPAVA